MSKMESMTKTQLFEICKQIGILKYKSKNKSQLINLIKEKEQCPKEEEKEEEMVEEGIKFIDLFCGIGGFHTALSRIGLKCVLACDIDKNCREVYKNNYKITPKDDIKNINENTMADFDILCGGFPCQPFSNGGKKKTFSDDRGLLFDEIIRIAKLKQPKFMFLENVKHIMKVSDGEVLEYIKIRLNSIGYKLQIFNISPHN